MTQSHGQEHGKVHANYGVGLVYGREWNPKSNDKLINYMEPGGFIGRCAV